MQLKNEQILKVYLPDTRGVRIEKRYGQGNLKIGMAEDGVFTYSRLPGLPGHYALGMVNDQPGMDEPKKIGGLPIEGPGRPHLQGTCPGASAECQAICYASRPVEEQDEVMLMWHRNSISEGVPPIPAECKKLRLHISGDFTSIYYIKTWAHRLIERPDVMMWAYTRSWRVAELLPALEELRKLPNVQLFASMDKSIAEVPPKGWRHAWIDGDPRAGKVYKLAPHGETGTYDHHNAKTELGTMTYLCPEQTKRAKNCAECGYCIDGTKNDVTFLEH